MIIGAGIFVITGTVATTNAGPAITISFAIAGLACALAALCYAEFASTVPVAGSAYTFSYATFGELIAWIIGWDLVLEFTIGAAALATSFSGYFQKVVDGTPFEVPAQLGSAADGTVDLPAVLISLLVTGVLIAGIKLSSLLNQIVVAIKLLVVAAVILFGVSHIERRQLLPLHPGLAAGPGRRRRLHGLHPGQHSASGSTLRSTASPGSSPAPRSCSSRSSASTSSRPPPRRPATRSATCRAASSARWRS